MERVKELVVSHGDAKGMAARWGVPEDRQGRFATILVALINDRIGETLRAAAAAAREESDGGLASRCEKLANEIAPYLASDIEDA